MDLLKSYLLMHWGERVYFAGFKNIRIDSYLYKRNSKLCDSFLVFMFVLLSIYLSILFYLHYINFQNITLKILSINLVNM
jgi:hypothetical protein